MDLGMSKVQFKGDEKIICNFEDFKNSSFPRRFSMLYIILDIKYDIAYNLSEIHDMKGFAP
jgi:hypothetical protein